MPEEFVQLTRDCVAMMVPQGARIVLQEGTELMITQALGNSFTVNVYGNLARISGRDADALGKETLNVLADFPADASIDDKVWAQLKLVFDPEIPVNIVDLGLIYECQATPLGKGQFAVKVVMTLTAAGCGMGPVIVDDAQSRVELIPEVEKVEVELVFDPPWDRSMMSEAAQLEMGVL